MTASRAGETVPVIIIGRDRAQRHSHIVFDPTAGTLIVAANHRLKVEKAIMRLVGRLKRRILLGQLFLKGDYLALKCRRAMLRGLRYLIRRVADG